MLIMGEAVHVWGQRVYEKSLYLLNFSVNLKLLLKKKKEALKNSIRKVIHMCYLDLYSTNKSHSKYIISF